MRAAKYRRADPARAKEIKAAFNERHRERVREANRLRMSAWHASNREASKERSRATYRRNRNKIIAAARAYRESAGGRQAIRTRNAKPQWRVDNRMRSAIYQALAGKKAGRSWEHLVGYTLDELTRHLERQFTKGMSWQNMGEWHIDHILARASFSYEVAEDPSFRACWALTNLRPLWANDNHQKSAHRTLLI